MRHQDTAGAVITFVFTLSGFFIAVYELVSPHSAWEFTWQAWNISVLTLLALVFSLFLLKFKGSRVFTWFTILCLVLVAPFCIIYGLHYILGCVVIALAGCVVHLA